MNIVHVGENGRTYARRFNHEEAARRWRAGETRSSLAREYGVTKSAISLAIARLTPDFRVKDNAYGAAYMREHYRAPCKAGCGTLVWTNRQGRTGLCQQCQALARARTVREDTLLCTRCGEWKPDKDFPRRSAAKARRGRAAFCRPCTTEARREHRRRHREQEAATARVRHARTGWIRKEQCDESDRCRGCRTQRRYLGGKNRHKMTCPLRREALTA